MTESTFAGITIKANPYLSWERYTKNIPRERVQTWKAVDRSNGGSMAADFSLRILSREEGLELLNSGPGRFVYFHNTKGMVDWFGMIRTVTLDTGVVRVVHDLRQMANRIIVRHTPVGGGAVTRATVNHTISQTRWGKKVYILGGGEMSAALASQRAQILLDQMFWSAPRLDSVNQSGQFREDALLEIQCMGIGEAMDFVVFNLVGGDPTDSASDLVATILADADVSQFIGSTDIEINVTVVPRETDSDRKPSDILTAIASVGDSDRNPFVWGVELDPGGLESRFYFRRGADYRIVGA